MNTDTSCSYVIPNSHADKDYKARQERLSELNRLFELVLPTPKYYPNHTHHYYLKPMDDYYKLEDYDESRWW